jgi:hypothetical protein
LTTRLERQAFQVAMGAACLVPLAAGGAGIVESAGMIGGMSRFPPDLDSHFRYLSGLLLGIGVAFTGCLFALDRTILLFRTLSGIVILGGIARLLSLATAGIPGGGHLFGLAMELGAVPALLGWHWRLLGDRSSHGDG